MTWEEIRQCYPGMFVKVKVLKDHIYNDVRYIEEMEVIKCYSDNIEATRDLVRAVNDTLVYHTSKEKIEIPIRQLFGFRGVV